jgi:hypothetical protein
MFGKLEIVPCSLVVFATTQPMLFAGPAPLQLLDVALLYQRVPLAVVPKMVVDEPVASGVAVSELEDEPQVVALKLEVIQHLVAEGVWFAAAALVEFELELSDVTSFLLLDPISLKDSGEPVSIAVILVQWSRLGCLEPQAAMKAFGHLTLDTQLVTVVSVARRIVVGMPLGSKEIEAAVVGRPVVVGTEHR